MFEVTPHRRKLVVIVLVGLAMVGGAIRYWAPNPSTGRDLGSLLLVLWVPVIGNVIGFFVRKIRIGRSGGFPAGQPFQAHLRIELTPLGGQPAPPPGDVCALVVGTEGFSVRLSLPLAAMRGVPTLTADAEFLHPALALPRFGSDATFRVVAQNRLVGQGRVLALLATPAIHTVRSRPAVAAPTDVRAQSSMDNSCMNTGYDNPGPALAEVESLSGPALLEFGTPWCGYCRAAQAPIAAALAEQPQVRHLKVEDGSGRPLGRAFKVKLWPTLVFLRDGREVARLVRPHGAGPIREALARTSAPA